MVAWRVLGTLGAVLVAAQTVAAQTVPLAETVRPGDCFRVRLDMSLNGEMHVWKEGEKINLPLEATAAHEYTERALAAGQLVDRAARLYDTAKAVIKVNGAGAERTLRPERRLLVAQHCQEGGVVFSTAGALRREEVDLTQHFDTLSVPGLLPGKEAAVGDTWKVADAAAVGLCGFDALAEQTLTCKLEGVADGQAVVSVKGPATGIEDGAQVKLTVDATARFDLQAKRVVAVEWTQQEEHDMGPVNPAATVKTTWKLRRSAVEQPDGLKDTALVSVPDAPEPPAALLAVEFDEPKGRFGMRHGRDWHMVSQTDEHVVFRLLERGELVAQVTLTPWTAAAAGQHQSPEDFTKQVNATPGWEPDKELQAGELPGGGRWVYRQSVLGRLDGAEVLQNFYLVAAPGGQQVAVTFTLSPKQADRLGTRDAEFVSALEVPAAKK